MTKSTFREDFTEKHPGLAFTVDSQELAGCRRRAKKKPSAIRMVDSNLQKPSNVPFD